MCSTTRGDSGHRMEPERPVVGVPAVDGVAGFSWGPDVACAPPVVTPGTPGAAPADRAVDGTAADLVVEAASVETFVAFYRSRRDVVARALGLTLGDVHLGAEAADEAMARAYQRWSRVGSFDDPAGWVYRVGLNWATSVLRRRRRAPRPPVDRDAGDVGTMAEPSVQAALAALDLRQRAVIVCRFYLGLSELETATALSTRPGTVKSRLHRGLRHLQADLEHLRPEESS